MCPRVSIMRSQTLSCCPTWEVLSLLSLGNWPIIVFHTSSEKGTSRSASSWVAIPSSSRLIPSLYLAIYICTYQLTASLYKWWITAALSIVIMICEDLMIPSRVTNDILMLAVTSMENGTRRYWHPHPQASLSGNGNMQLSVEERTMLRSASLVGCATLQPCPIGW